jgi:hypothetical protein
MNYASRAPDMPLNDEIARSVVATQLPPGLTLLEQATAALRRHLRALGLDDYCIYHSFEFDLSDIDQHLPQLDPHAIWRPLPLLGDGEQPGVMEVEDDAITTRSVGVLHLPRHHFVITRWHWMNDENDRCIMALGAAPDPAAHARLHRAVVDLRRRAGPPTWEIVRNSYTRSTRPRTATAWVDLLLAPEVRGRLESEVCGFFDERVAALYREMGVPYRRGVLMHGPPGNGKTSIIRALGGNLPHVYAMILRPDDTLGAGQLASIFRRWRNHAPAILVIEDLDHLLKDYVNLSHLLNQLDGIDTQSTAGLLLIATTNHPDRLDPALNNRPGRFDVVIEIPAPDAALRNTFFQGALPACDPAVIEKLVFETADLSFSHLHEVVRLSGLIAIHDGSRTRESCHLLQAVRLVSAGQRSARLGFPLTTETPFGLAQFRKKD